MFRPQIQRTSVLALLAFFIMLMVYCAVNSYEKEPTYGYNIKKKSIGIMQNSIESLREEFISRGISSGLDSLSFGSFLIGPKKSPIQTTYGSLISKQSVLNLDFAAMIVEMLVELNVNKESKIAVSYTGSYPGANLAVLAALEAMNISSIIISSCGSSEYGATDSRFTWIDMEKFLYQNKTFSNSSSLSSIGGGLDQGAQLSSSGKKICESSIYNNKNSILEFSTPYQNINNRMTYYNQRDEIAAYINIGGGVYSIGDSIQRKNTPVGIIYPGDIPIKSNGTVIERFLDAGVPVININRINELADWYELPYPPKKGEKFGIGNLFYLKTDYNSMIILITFIVSIGIVLSIGIKSHIEIKKRMNSSEPESLL